MKNNKFLKNFSFKSPNHNDTRTFDFLIFFSTLFILFIFTIWYNGVFSVLSWHVGFIDPSSSFAESLIKLYNVLWFVLVWILILVLVLLVRIIYLFTWKANYYKSNVIQQIVNNFLYVISLIALYLSDLSALYNSLKRYNRLSSNKRILNLWYSQPNVNQPYEYLNISDLSEYKKLEVVWCVLPAAVLLSLISPTFSLIFSLDSCADPAFTIKVVGKQWYWTYAYDVNVIITDENHPDFPKEQFVAHHYYGRRLIREFNDKYYSNAKFISPGTAYDYLGNIEAQAEFDKVLVKIAEASESIYKVNYSFEFDSVMKAEDDLTQGTHRLLEVDQRMVVPVGVPIRFIITSADVLHSWAVPALGIKVDAVPGRLNQFFVEIKKPGVYYGQCSELCGPLHGFMPIVVEAVPMEEFEVWLSNMYHKLNS